MPGNIGPVMEQEPDFDRFDGPARLALFCAREAVSEHGGEALGDAHLLLGILKAAPDLQGLLQPAVAIQRLSECLVGRLATTVLHSTGVEVPLDTAAVKILHASTQLADTLGGPEVTPAHLLLALLREPSDAVASCLHAAGVDVDLTREAVASRLRLSGQ